MIETALDVTDGAVPGFVIAELIAAGREMLEHPVQLMPHAKEAVTALRESGFRVLLIKKGDLRDQERKLAQSGLGDMFDAVEIVSDKTESVYKRIFTRHGDGAEHAMMIGNSLKSDVLPVLQAGGWAVHVPQEATWALEHAEQPVATARFHALAHLGLVPDLARILAN